MTKTKKSRKMSSSGRHGRQDHAEPPNKKAKEAPAVVDDNEKASGSKDAGRFEREIPAVEPGVASGQGDEALPNMETFATKKSVFGPEDTVLPIPKTLAVETERSNSEPNDEALTLAVETTKTASEPDGKALQKPESLAVETAETASGPEDEALLKLETPAVKAEKSDSGPEDKVHPKPETPAKNRVSFAEDETPTVEKGEITGAGDSCLSPAKTASGPEDDDLPKPETPAKKRVSFAEDVTPTVEEGEITGAEDSTGGGPEVVADVAPVLEE